MEMVEKFKDLYKEEFGEDISLQEAQEQGTKLLNLMKVIYQPLPQKNLGKLNN